MTTVRFSLMLGVWLLLASHALAQPPLRLTLAEALAQGTDASRRLAEIQARQAAARAAVEARQADVRPVVAVQAGYVRTNHIDPFGVPQPDGRFRVIFPDIPDNYRTRVDLQWPLYTGGRGVALVAVAEAEQSALGRDLSAARSDLRLEITRAYWALVTANETVQVVETSVQRMDAHLGDMRHRLEVGLVPPSDVLAIEAQRSRQQALAIEARNAREAAALSLRRLLGVELDTPLELAEPLDVPPAPILPSKALVDEALKRRADRAGLQLRVTAAAQRVAAVRAGLLPSVVVTGGYDYARPNNRILPRRDEWHDSWDLNVNVSWPLLDGGRTRAAMAEAEAQRLAAQWRLEEFDSVVAVDVGQRRLDLEAAQALIAPGRDAVRSATEAHRVIGERFAAGVATSTEVLDAQVVLLQADLDLTRARTAARLAAARLEHALGR